MGLRASRAGTARPRARISSRSRSTHFWSTPSHAHARRGSTGGRDFALLLHDAPEYVIGDMISPFKAVIGGAYKVVEARLMAAIHIRFGLPPQRSAEIDRLLKVADRGAAFLEATRLAGFSVAEARRFFGTPPPLSPALERDYLTPWTAGTAKKRFLERFAALAQD